MPAKKLWQQFFKPEQFLRRMQLDDHVKDAADFGCGYGTFSIPAAMVVKGTVFAIDVEEEMIAITAKEAEEYGLQNIKTILRDFMADGTGLADASLDYVMLFNILHVEQPERLLQEAHRILTPRGKLGIIHWNDDPTTPRGPSMSIRPKPEQCVAWAEQTGFVAPTHHDLEPYHFGIVMKKEDGR